MDKVQYYKNGLKKILLAKMACLAGKPLPIKITIPITFKCNLKCNTCNIWSENINKFDNLKNELNKEEWFKFFDEVGSYVFWLGIAGGEFSLRNDIIDIILYVLQKTEITAVGITTNGMLKEKIIGIIRSILNSIPQEKTLQVTLSLDGIENIHDHIRGHKGVFQNIVSLFKELKQIEKNYNNFCVNIAYTISNSNVGMLNDFWIKIRRIVQLSENDISFSFQHYTHGYRIEKIQGYTREFKEKINQDINAALHILKSRSGNGLFYEINRLMDNFYVKNISNFIRNPQKMIIPCVSAANCSSYIEPDGTIYPCGHWNYPLGNIKNGFLNIWHADKTRIARQIIKKKLCSNCWGTCEFPQRWQLGGGLIKGWW